MKKIFKRIVAAFLVAVMLFGSAPLESLTGIDLGGLFELEAEAVSESTVKDVINSIAKEYPHGSYFSVNGKRCEHHSGWNGFSDGTLCYNCYLGSILDKKGISRSNYNYDGRTCWAFASYCFTKCFGLKWVEGNYTSIKSISKIYKKTNSELYAFFKNAKIGDTLVYSPTHYSVFISCDSSGYTVYDSNIGGSDSYTGYVRYKKLSYDYLRECSSSVTIKRAKNYDVTNNITVTPKDVTDLTNNSATISASLSQKVKLQEYGYVISTKKADVDVDLTKSDNRKDTSTRDYVTNKSSDSKNSVSMTVNKILDKDLSPNTTYYYKMVVKTGDKWFQSGVKSFKTKNNAPGISSLSVSNANADIGIGDAAAVSWTESSNAKSYILNLYYDGSNIYAEDDIKGTTFAFPASCFDKAGEYEVKLFAKNEVKTVEMTETVTIIVHDDVTVTFVDGISGDTIETQQITYGHSAGAPVDPSQYGYTFKGWDKSFDKVTEDITVTAIYEANEYTVKFVDGVTGKIYKTEKVKFNTAATAPNESELTIPEGHEFMAWDKDFSAVQGDTTVTSVYKWYNENYPLKSTIDADDDGYADVVTRNEDKNGYDVTVKVTNNIDEIVKGRLVVVLKTESGYQYAETESSAFSISAKGTKEIDVFVLSDILAYSVEVYTINDYETSGVLATPVAANIDNSGAWSNLTAYEGDTSVFDEHTGVTSIEYKKDGDNIYYRYQTGEEWSKWTEYNGKMPAVDGEDNVSSVEIRKTVSPTLYRYKVKETTTSYATSMSGWTQNGYTKQKNGTGTYYYASYPSGFDKDNSLYSKYNKKKANDTDTSTTIRDYSDPVFHTYIYWHWAYELAEKCKPYDRYINDKKGSASGYYFDQFAAFEDKESYEKTAGVYFKNRGNYTDISWWWFRFSVYKQTYTDYKKLYNYYRWTDWTEYSETDPRTTVLAGKTEGTDYEIETIEGSTTYEYRYKSADLVANDIAVPENQIESINAEVSTEFAGKEATVFVHKYTQPSDFTTEYVGKTTVGADGSVVIEKVKLREALSIETGDFKAVASIGGNTGLIELQTFEAPKPKYTVEFYDYNADGEMKKVIYRAVVEQGETVTAPSIDSLTIPEGYKFSRWNQSTVNVNGDLKVYPEIEKEEFVVVFVDWGSREVSLKEMNYGDVIEPPTAAKVENMNVSWDMSNATADEETLDDGTVVTKYIVTQNTVITTNYTEKEVITGFIKPGDTPEETEEKANEILKGETPADDEIVKVPTPVGVHVDPPADIEENPEYIFYGWKNIDTGEYLTDTTAKENATYYPVYEFAYTTDMPVADLESKDYSEAQTVTLTCDTENSVIWYTTDGSDPVTSETATEYTAPVEITESCVLKFYAQCFGMNDSSVVTEVYAINNSTVYYFVYTVYTNIPAQGNAVFQALIRENTSFDASTLGTFDGYTYEGLFYDEEYTDEYTSEEDYAYESTTLYAKFTPNTYTVKFVDYDGETLSTQTVEYSSSATPPEVAEREGYVFVGWDSEDYQCVTADGTYTAMYVSEDEYARISFSRKSTKKSVGSEFNAGKLVKITPAEMSDTLISWSTSNADIATVDHNGIITFVSEGTAVITATVDSSGESADFTVIVFQDTDNNLVLAMGSVLGFDSYGYIRGLKPGDNTVADVKRHFSNYDEKTEDIVDTKLVFVNMDGTELADDGLVGTGTVVNLVKKDTGEVLDSRVFVVPGDYDGDGYINNVDSVRTARYNVDKENPNDYQMLAMDVNGDGYVNNRDAAMISRYLVGKETF